MFDPVDGTTNYAHGLPIFCSSLALEISGVPAVAAIYDPSRRELFTAERGQGAWLNGAPLRVSTSATLIDSLLCTGFPYSVQQDAGSLVGLFAEFLGVSRAVRRLGSAALDLCYVAAGRLDGFWEQSLHPWDMAAGALIVQEAGGRVTDLRGGPYSSRRESIVATNGRCPRPDGGHNRYVLQTSGRRPVDRSPKLRTGPAIADRLPQRAVCSRADGLTSDEYTSTAGNPGFTQVLAPWRGIVHAPASRDWAGPARKGCLPKRSF